MKCKVAFLGTKSSDLWYTIFMRSSRISQAAVPSRPELYVLCMDCGCHLAMAKEGEVIYNANIKAQP